MKYWKSAPYLLWLVAAACQPSDAPEDGLRALSNGPDLPETCEVCWLNFEDCADSGMDLQMCEEEAIACAQNCEAPPPPPSCDHCFAGYEACVDVLGQNMAEPADCVAGLEGCLGSCEGSPPEPCDSQEGADCPQPCDYVDPSGTCWDSCEAYCEETCFGDDTPGSPAGIACTQDMYMECLDRCELPEPPPCEHADPATGECLDCHQVCEIRCDDGQGEECPSFEECLADCEAPTDA